MPFDFAGLRRWPRVFMILTDGLKNYTRLFDYPIYLSAFAYIMGAKLEQSASIDFFNFPFNHPCKLNGYR